MLHYHILYCRLGLAGLTGAGGGESAAERAGWQVSRASVEASGSLSRSQSYYTLHESGLPEVRGRGVGEERVQR